MTIDRTRQKRYFHLEEFPLYELTDTIENVIKLFQDIQKKYSQQYSGSEIEVDYDSDEPYIIIEAERYETDEEYNKRIEEEEKKEERIKNQIENEKKRELKEFERIKKKYGL